MPIAVVAVIGGLYLLSRAADEFVVGAARLSVALKISPVVIGAVVIGFGTSAPEMVVSAIGAAQGELDIAAGNIIGSNVANLSLVLGVAGLVVPLSIKGTTLRREAPLSTGAVIVFALLVQDGITAAEAGIALVLLVAALSFVLISARSGGDEDDLADEVGEYLEDGAEHRTGFEVLRTLGGLTGVVVGAYITIEGALTIADELGLEEGFVGLTLVALGTSLPELVTSVAAARKGEDDLIVGNLLGSNLFNSLAVVAAAGFAAAGFDQSSALSDPDLTGLATYVMVGVAIGAYVFMASGRTLVRWEALVLLGTYSVTVPLLAA